MNRIRQAREARGISTNQLAEQMNVHQSTISNWESGRRDVLSGALLELSIILEFSVDYLLGRDIITPPQDEPVDRNMLGMLHGQPVWTASHGWMLVDIVKRIFISCDNGNIPFDNIGDNLYLVPPAMALSLRGIGKPLAPEMLADCGRVWVEPVTTDVRLGAELRGWYRLHDGGRLVENEFGNRFYLDNYGAKWLAFKECIDR